MIQLLKKYACRVVLISFSILGLFASYASAQTYSATGFPVNAMGSTTAVGSVQSDGFIRYFIPFSPSASGTYAVDNGGRTGLFADTGSPGGTLSMFLAFGPITGPVANASIDISFEDLDLLPVNDGAGSFHETIQFFGANGSSGLIDNLNDDTSVYQITGNNDSQRIVINDPSTLSPLTSVGGKDYFFMRVDFTAMNASGKNTVELFRPKFLYSKKKLYEISGTATFLGTNLVIPNVQISGTGGLGTTSTNASGDYEYGNVPENTYTLTASKPGYRVVSNPNPVLVDDANVTDADFVLTCASGYKRVNQVDCVPIYNISGTTYFRSTTTPLSGVSVTSTGGLPAQTSATNGGYTFTSVVNGSYTLNASRAGYVVVSQSFSNPVVVAGANRTNKNFILDCAPGYIRANQTDCVRVHNISGTTYFRSTTTPLSGVSVTSSGGLPAQTSAANGGYTFTSVANGSYTLNASRAGYVVVSQNFSNPVVVAGANQVNKNFILDCAPGYIRANQTDCVAVQNISGTTYFRSTTTPLSGVSVTSSGGLPAQTSAANGGYTFTSVVDGSYTLNASLAGYVVVSQNFTNPVVVAGANQVNKNFILDCAPGYLFAGGSCQAIYSISGTARMVGSNAPVSGVMVTETTLPGQMTAPDGTYIFGNVLDGSYTLAASKPGYVVVSQNFSNPVVVAGGVQVNKDFVLDCEKGFTLSANQCIQIQETIIIEASDGTFRDYVLVSWIQTTVANSCELYRSDIAGPLGQLLATIPANSEYQDTSATPDVHYFYTAICDNGSRSNQDEGWRPGDEEVCEEGDECIFEELEPFACASANGFLGQVNIATVINRFTTNLDVLVEYRDLFGTTKGSAQANIEPLQKMDFIVNELGLEADTYGTVCVTVSTTALGAWGGGITLYKANTRDGDASFGSDFDFALYYPFTNPRVGGYTLPLNTFHLGVPQSATIANWIRITDAEQGDGEKLRGTLFFYDAEGAEISANYIELADGGRYDFSGHEGLAGFDNHDAIGMARFEPADKADGSAAKYYISLGRYFYDCVGASCENFFTAFIIPNRPATTVATSGGVSTVDGELTVIELNNSLSSDATADVSTFQSVGIASGGTSLPIPARGTQHTIVNQSGALGFFAAETVGSATVQATDGAISATSIFYKLDQNGVLAYAYAAPLTASPGVVQVSQYNSFIGNQNTAEIFNSSSELTITAQINVTDDQNVNVLSMDVTLRPNETRRFPLAVPSDTYGTITIQSDEEGIVFRNYVSVKGEYVLSFGAK